MANHTILGGAGNTTITLPTGAGVAGSSNITYTTTGAFNTAVGYNGSWGAGIGPITTTGISNNSLEVTGNANFKGDVTIDGVSVKDTLKKIQDRLAILVPDPKKLEQYEALQKAYRNYKMLEALCEEQDDNSK